MDEKRKQEAARRAKMDDFWDIDALLPKKRPMPYAADTSTTEIVVDVPRTTAPPTQAIPTRQAERPTATSTARSTASKHRDERQVVEYAPDHVLIHKVRILRWKSDYRYYESFFRDAAKLYPIRGVACPHVPFFSYVPQYSQLNRPQLEWYLWWREQFRRGEAPETDYTYLLLYAYELVNLSENTDPQKTCEALCRLWTEYRQTFPQMDTYLPEWICDLCLLHRLPPPCVEEPRLQSILLSHCSLKEFYAAGSGDEGFLRALVLFCSNHDYRKSKFYTKETQELFDRVILGTVKVVAERTEQDGKPFAASKLERSEISRYAYTGALCSPSIRKRIDVEYFSFSRSHELRILITDIVKYTENQIRAAIGVRSRLGIYALPPIIRGLIDSYLSGVLPAHRKQPTKSAEKEIPAYEKLYDVPHAPISFEAAAQIERLSWETTERLVEAFTEEGARQDDNTDGEMLSPQTLPIAEDVPKVEEEQSLPTTEIETKEKDAAVDSPFAPYASLLRATLAENVQEQKDAARMAEKTLDVFVDELNELAAEETGDILLEEADVGYCVIEDYREWLRDLLSRL